MKRAKQKLHSQSGISILMALLLMLVAAMISAVILSAAVTAAERVHDDTREQQDILSVDSAARLFVQLLQNRTYQFTDYFFDDDAGSKDHTEYDLANNSPYVLFLANATDQLESGKSDLWQYEESDTSKKHPYISWGTMSFSVPDGYEGLSDATVEFERVYLDKTLNTEGSSGSDYKTWYTLTGTIYLGNVADGSPRKVFFTAQMNKEIYLFYDSWEYYEFKQVADGVQILDQKKGDSVTYTWTVEKVLLASSQDMLREKEET